MKISNTNRKEGGERRGRRKERRKEGKEKGPCHHHHRHEERPQRREEGREKVVPLGWRRLREGFWCRQTVSCASEWDMSPGYALQPNYGPMLCALRHRKISWDISASGSSLACSLPGCFWIVRTIPSPVIGRNHSAADKFSQAVLFYNKKL